MANDNSSEQRQLASLCPATLNMADDNDSEQRQSATSPVNNMINVDLSMVDNSSNAKTQDPGSEQRQSTTSPAVERVFGVPELLEKILLSVGDRRALEDDIDEDYDETWPDFGVRLWGNAVKDLYVLQRVSKMFKAVIETSIKLRRVMLLEHDPATGSDNLPTGHRPFGMHFLLNYEQAALGFHPAIPCLDPDAHEVSVNGGKNGIAKETFYINFVDMGTSVGCKCSSYANYKAGCRSLDRHASSKDRGKLAHGATWRRMLLCNRPTDVVIDLWLQLKILEEEPWISEDYYDQYLHIDEGTATLGGLYDILENVTRRSAALHRRTAKEFLAMKKLLQDGLDDWSRYRPSYMTSNVVETLLKEAQIHSDTKDCGRREGDCHYCNAMQDPLSQRLANYELFCGEVKKRDEARKTKRDEENRREAAWWVAYAKADAEEKKRLMT